jgi:hypothetical protein
MFGIDGNFFSVGTLEFMPPHMKRIVVTLDACYDSNGSNDCDQDERPQILRTETVRSLLD